MKKTFALIMVIAGIVIVPSVIAVANNNIPSEGQYAMALVSVASPKAKALVADGNVTDQEYESALEIYRQCITDVGFTPVDTLSPNGLPSLATVAEGPIAESAKAWAAKDLCDADWRLIISVAYASRSTDRVGNDAVQDALSCHKVEREGSEKLERCLKASGAESAVPGIIEAATKQSGS